MKSIGYERRRSMQLKLLLAPSVVLLFALVVYPALYSIYLGFTNEALSGPAAMNPRWVGLRNYIRLFSDDDFWHSLLVTFWFVVGSAIIGQFALGMIAAIALRKPFKLRPIVNAIILLPNAVPEVVAGFVWISMFGSGEYGTLNRIVGWFGIEHQTWLATFPVTMIIIVNTWRGIAFAMILLTSGLSSISEEVYEAARMDGATPFQIFRRITLPLLMPTIFLYMLVSTVSTIAIFGLIYMLTRGGPGGATEIISIYIYNQSFTAFQLGFGAAVAVVMLIFSIAIGIFYVKALKVEV